MRLVRTRRRGRFGRLSQWRLARRRARLGSRGRKPSGATFALLGSLVVLLGSVVACFAFLRPASPGQQLSLDELTALIGARRVASAQLLDEDARIEVVVTEVSFPAPQANSTAADAPTTPPWVLQRASDLGPGKFWTTYPRNDTTNSQLITDLTGAGARITVDAQGAKAIVRVVLTVLLPLMILANLFALFLTVGRGGSSALGEVISFGSIGKRKLAGSGDVTFGDVAGLEEAVVELKEVVDYLSYPARYEELGAAPPKGVLLTGPPGCGKTLLARAVAGEAGVPFFSIAGAEFVESLVGVGAARVRDLFRRVRTVAPAIVFIDELDAAGRRRSAAGGGSEERDQTLNQLLVEMDGFETGSGIVVMAATNRSDILDPALLRPGRFDRHISIDRPDVERREAILRLHAKRLPLETNIDFGLLSRRTPGFSGADLASVVNEAALLTIRHSETSVGPAAFSEAVQRVAEGPQRRAHVLTAEERRRIAAHEAGHAVAAVAHGFDVHRVAVLARGRGLGAAGVERGEEEPVATRSRLLARLVVLMAGAAAEEVVLGESSTGAEDDLEEATVLARDIVGRFGMSDELGRVRLLAPDIDIALDAAAGLGPMAPDSHARFDAAVRRLIDDAYRDAVLLVERDRGRLDALVRRLLADETVEGPELEALLTGEPGATANGNGARERRPVRHRITPTQPEGAPVTPKTAPGRSRSG